MLLPPFRPSLKALWSFLAFWLFLFLFSFIPLSARWIHNQFDVAAVDLVLPIILSLITTFVIGCIFYPSLAKERLATLIGSLFLTKLIDDYHSIRTDVLLPLFENYTHSLFSQLLVIGLLLLSLVLLTKYSGLLLARLIRKLKFERIDFAGGLVVVILVIGLIQAGSVARLLIIEWQQFFYSPPNQALTPLSAAPSKPDIYYIVLDRYTNSTVLNDDFQYDNADFTNFLTANQFYVNPTAHSNYPYTTMSVSATLNADYHTDLVKKFKASSLQNLTPYHRIIQQGAVIQNLKRLGYSYYHLGTWYEATNRAPLADHYYQADGQLTLFGRTFTINTFPKREVATSFYRWLVVHGLRIGAFDVLHYSDQNEIEATQAKLSTLKQLANESAGSRFIFAHMLVPHDPYFFNADGSLAEFSGTNNEGEPIQKKYLRQVAFINTQMKEIISSIQEHSQNQAIIIVQADEGPYPMHLLDQQFESKQVDKELNESNMEQWKDESLRMKYGILAAYHLPAASPESLQQGADSVNIFRLVFNTYFQGKLPYLPRCYYGFTEGRSHSFVYQDLTERLTSAKNLACPNDSQF